MKLGMPWHAGRPRPWPHCVRWGPSSPPSKGNGPAIFGPFSVVAKWQDGLRCHLVWGYASRDPVTWGPSSPSQKGRGAPCHPKLSAHVYCGQTAAWMKIALGMKVGLGSRHIVLDGNPATLPKKRSETLPPIFGPFLLRPNGSMHQDATWYGGRPHLRRHCLRCGSSSP